jgi:hypothetical protein
VTFGMQEQRTPTTRMERDMAELATNRGNLVEQQRAQSKVRDRIDIAGGVLIFGLSYVLCFGFPASLGMVIYAVLTLAVGAGTGWLMAHQRGHWGLAIFGGGAVADVILLTLVFGDIGAGLMWVILRAFMMTLLGGMLALSRRSSVNGV